MSRVEALIRLYTCDAMTFTTQEYEQIERDVLGRAIASCSELGDKVLYKLLCEHRGRYHEAKERNMMLDKKSEE